MNVAALVAGPAVDTLREVIPKSNDPDHFSAYRFEILSKHFQYSLMPYLRNHFQSFEYRVVIATGGVSTLVGLFIVIGFVREVETSSEGEVKQFK